MKIHEQTPPLATDQGEPGGGRRGQAPARRSSLGGRYLGQQTGEEGKGALPSPAKRSPSASAAPETGEQPRSSEPSPQATHTSKCLTINNKPVFLITQPLSANQDSGSLDTLSC